MWYIENNRIAHCKSTKPMYIAVVLPDDPDKCTVISGGEAKEAVAYRASHEEADDRTMFSIHQLYEKYTVGSPFIKDSLSITVVTPDTDIFVVLMYNLKNTLKDLGSYLLKKGQIIMPQKHQQELYPLHLLLSKLDPKVIDQLSAGHSLTVAKVGTKKELLHILNSFYPLITDFGMVTCYNRPSSSL